MNAADAARRAVERSRQEQGLPPTVTDRRALERVAQVLSSASAAGSDPGRNDSGRAGRDRPRHARVRRK